MKRRLHKQPKNTQGMQLFVQLCQQKAAQNKLEEIITLFLTPEEQEHINARMLIVKALIENQMTQRELAAHFGVSIGQITRGSNAVKTLSNQFLEELSLFFASQDNKQQSKGTPS